MEEKRKFVRLQWPVVVKYKALQEPRTGDQIVGKDISEGGACFIAYERLPVGTILDIQLEFPFDSMPIFAKGEVAWIKKLSEEHAATFEVGISFNEVNPQDKKRLKMYIDNEIKRRQSRGPSG